MNREEFISVLDNHYCKYKIDKDGDIIVFTGTDEYGRVDIINLETLPSGVEFRNDGHVIFNNVANIPSGVYFRNNGDVELDSLVEISSDVEFNNTEDVVLRPIKNIPPGLEFNNGGSVYLHLLNIKTNINKSFEWFYPEIDGIYDNRVLNLMIKRELLV